MTAALTEEDQLALKTSISDMATRSVDVRGVLINNMRNPIRDVDTSYGTEILFLGIFDGKEETRSKGFGKLEDKNVSGVGIGAKFFAGVEGLLLEVGMKYKRYNIETPTDNDGIKHTLKVTTETYSLNASKTFAKGIKLSIYGKSDEFKKYDSFSGESVNVNDGPRTILTTGYLATAGAEIEIPFKIGSGPAKSK